MAIFYTNQIWDLHLLCEKFLRSVAVAYMTGILPVKKYGAHSALNMFFEYSMIDQKELEEYTGFTEDEVRKLCERFDMDFDGLNILVR